MAPREALTAEQLREVLDYDADTGIFTWKKLRPGGLEPGMAAGSPDNRGYMRISVLNRRYKAHRLAWLYVYGEWPPDCVDHINGVKGDNRIINLRLASRSQNNANRPAYSNNASGIKGVYWEPRRKRWSAQITLNGKKELLGLFREKHAAADAYMEAAKRLFGEFARAG